MEELILFVLTILCVLCVIQIYSDWRRSYQITNFFKQWDAIIEESKHIHADMVRVTNQAKEYSQIINGDAQKMENIKETIADDLTTLSGGINRLNDWVKEYCDHGNAVKAATYVYKKYELEK